MRDYIYLFPVIPWSTIERNQDSSQQNSTVKEILTMINVRFFHEINHYWKKGRQ